MTTRKDVLPNGKKKNYITVNIQMIITKYVTSTMKTNQKLHLLYGISNNLDVEFIKL